MRRDGTDPDNVQMSDVLCDFCAQEWTADRQMVEGHHGSCICAPCLTDAFRAVVLEGRDDAADARAPSECSGTTERSESADNAAPRCTMCLETRSEPHWRGLGRPQALACRRCIKMASVILERDPDAAWARPTAGAP
ncbi:MAG: hypothetical protein FGM37_03940 [Phycisphaerales bacterium]|nr:hypothetical protein [Phycisphaerales bacterium]